MENEFLWLPVILKCMHACRLGMSIDSITHVERERTKRVVYAVIYGVGKLEYWFNECNWFGQGFWVFVRSELCCIITTTGKERLAEILNVDSTIAKELRASFLRKFQNHPFTVSLSKLMFLCVQKNFQMYKSSSPAPFQKPERKVHSQFIFSDVFYWLVQICLRTYT